ncbi:SRPBCC domain-containing protein [Streptomyces sp. E11-3]|uniref:SRPBCC domain-containing protein n=1 Tax=Streptomyces sp. E11-3 TaxID=3110112 RepID=UPI003980EFD2
MEHEAFVPVPTEPLRQALGDPARVARAIPGLQRDAADAGVAGRLKVRIAGHTITYRGTLRLTKQPSRDYTIEGDATESRGAGTVKLALTLRLSPTDDGTTLTFSGTATADGRAAELEPAAVDSATRRLLNRCAAGLATEAARGAAADDDGASPDAADVDADAPSPGMDEWADNGGAVLGGGGAATDDRATDDRAAGVGDAEEGEEQAEEADEVAEVADPVVDGGAGLDDDGVASVFDTEVPPPSLARFDDEDMSPPAEAAHARRTMIGRSAEEVDHAPPRGRYAPVPAPATTVSASDALRWAAPAAALVVASAIVAGRVLRRRK